MDLTRKKNRYKTGTSLGLQGHRFPTTYLAWHVATLAPFDISAAQKSTLTALVSVMASIHGCFRAETHVQRGPES